MGYRLPSGQPHARNGWLLRRKFTDGSASHTAELQFSFQLSEQAYYTNPTRIVEI